MKRNVSALQEGRRADDKEKGSYSHKRPGGKGHRARARTVTGG